MEFEGCIDHALLGGKPFNAVKCTKSSHRCATKFSNFLGRDAFLGQQRSYLQFFAPFIQIVPAENKQNSFFIFSAYIEATESLNTTMEHEF